mmetsp:Transcript_32400/g.92286  ORF Transcript_32400/g.92286 Transcript_32400/m.92286 type:complete len:274 (+) Transcript_32400:177-998(+)|eukprot:CAMPEP_0176208516 /NCGR_PEP_ID=MMETSP0121_2-20121125/13161_1 /TAXON_ID=160619 /ORGANISM="Kryptoperidinium foliaceum, Strain CCMP 1326" /LENGTH=273 /DNA_ID=CAMNT_0017547505 /DNA_START=95 /DNA_END=916 /DNA_ORIENTATION=+
MAPSVADVLELGFARDHFFVYMRLRDVASLEAASRAVAQRSILGQGAWAVCACVAARERAVHIPTPSPGEVCKRSVRRAMAPLLPGLATVSLARPLRLGSFALARELACALDGARSRAHARFAKGGALGKVAVARLRFSPSTGSSWLVSSRVAIDIGHCQTDPWELRMAYGETGLLVGARRRRSAAVAAPCRAAAEASVLVDVHSVSEGHGIRAADVQLHADGRWSEAMCFRGDCKALREGVLLVISIRQLEFPAPRSSSVLHALNIDLPSAR